MNDEGVQLAIKAPAGDQYPPIPMIVYFGRNHRIIPFESVAAFMDCPDDQGRNILGAQASSTLGRGAAGGSSAGAGPSETSSSRRTAQPVGARYGAFVVAAADAGLEGEEEIRSVCAVPRRRGGSGEVKHTMIARSTQYSVLTLKRMTHPALSDPRASIALDEDHYARSCPRGYTNAPKLFHPKFGEGTAAECWAARAAGKPDGWHGTTIGNTKTIHTILQPPPGEPHKGTTLR